MFYFFIEFKDFASLKTIGKVDEAGERKPIAQSFSALQS